MAAAYEYYAEANADLAEELLDELDRLLQRLSIFPRSAQPVDGYAGVRRALLHRFPFAAFYIVGEDEIAVLRVIHTARSPEERPEA